MSLDKTLEDINRRELEFQQSHVGAVFPEHYATEYPKLTSLMETYYKFLDSDTTDFGNQIKSLSKTRDIGQTAESNLTFIEDELLLGQNYLQGILDQRTGAELSNNFYRSKGSKFSIERFFRAFFNTDPTIVYGKDLTFNIGETNIGPESGKFIQDDKIYQFWGILIKTGVPVVDWLDMYKLFVHPGGMYVGAAVEIVGFANLGVSGFFYLNDQDTTPVQIPGQANLGMLQFGETLAMVTHSDATRGLLTDSAEHYRLRTDNMSFQDFADSSRYTAGSDSAGTIQFAADRYNTMIGMSDVTVFRVDQDSDKGLLTSLDTSLETIDQDVYNYNDSA
tara:strand:+ start:1110 stop:2114 length:1005 start_codon:yes stop_codon:yes gene_type:complete